MLKKILIVLLILAPSALYLYLVNRDHAPSSATESSNTPAETVQSPQYQTPEH